MQHKQFWIKLLVVTVLLSSCSTTKTLLDKTKTEYGTIKFYLDSKPEKDIASKRVLATVDNSIFYSFYPDKIIKQTKLEKNLISTLLYKQLPALFDTTAYQRLSSLDSSVLMRGDKILDSLKLTNYKKSSGATAFEVELNYYHGYPDNKKFRP